MNKLIVSLLFASTSMFGQYTVAPGGAQPADLAPGFDAVLEKKGTKLLKGGKEIGQIWFRAAMPAAVKSSEPNISMGMVAHGTLLAVVKFDAIHADRRGQTHPHPGRLRLGPGSRTARGVLEGRPIPCARPGNR